MRARTATRGMRIFARALLFVVATGIGLAVGFSLRARHAHMVANGNASQRAAAMRPPVVSKGRAAGRVVDESPLATQLEKNLALSTSVTRWLYWLEALEKAAPSDFPRLARLAQGNPSAVRLVATRWAEVAPRHMFNTLVAASKETKSQPLWELTHPLFDIWPRNDPEAAIAALNEPGDFGMRGSWRMDVATTILRTDVEQGLRLMANWHIENYDPGMGAIAKWAAADPRHAAEFTLQNSLGYVAQRAADTIGQEWAKSDPAGAMAFATANPGGLGTVLGAAALKQWAEGNLTDAAQWLADADAQTRNRLSPAFVEAWAQKDAGSALSWCDENLSGSSLVQAVGGVLKGAADKDVARAAALVTGMDPSPARAEAAFAVARKWFPEMSSGEAAKPEAIAWLGGLDADSIRRVFEEGVVQWGWACSDPKSMAAFLATASAGEIPASAYSILVRQMVRQSPLDTLDWASHLPADCALSAGSDAFAEWCNSQPEAATRWLDALAPTDNRRQPYFQSAIQTMAYHPQATEQFAAMPTADRAAARSVIEGMSLPEPRRSDLLNALTAH
jgi:hypothetical protein